MLTLESVPTPKAAPGNTVAHFGDLLGYADMDRRSAGERDDRPTTLNSVGQVPTSERKRP
jgi:hypothetical protein